MNTANKLSYHIPASDQHIADLLNIVCAATGHTPSSWVYGTIIDRLQGAGLIDKNKEINLSAYKELIGSLAPGILESLRQRKDQKHAKHRSKKNP